MRWFMLLLLAGAVGASAALYQNPRLLSNTGWLGSVVAPKESPGALLPAPSPSASRAIFASGLVEGSHPEVPLRFEIVGRLSAINTEEGKPVKAGEVLAELESNDLLARQREAVAQLELANAERERIVNGESPETRQVARAMVNVAQARLDQAKLQFDRNARLIERKAVSQQEFDDAQSEMKRAQAELEAAQARVAEVEAKARTDELAVADAKISSAQARVDQASAALAKTRLLAPTDGRILQINGEVGEIMFPDRTEPVIIMVNVDAMHVRAFVEELDAFRVRPGMPAYGIADGKPEVRFVGQVVFCAPYMVPKTTFSNTPGERVDVKVREVLIRLESSADLVVGLPVDVYFEPPPPSPTGTARS